MDIKHKCEVCGATDFYVYDYPTDLSPIVTKLKKNNRRIFWINTLKMFLRFFFKFLPQEFLQDIRRRAFLPYAKKSTPNETEKVINNLYKGITLFTNRKIIICKICDLGVAYPLISEEDLVNYYKNDYWIAGIGGIEPCENPRTISTLGLLQKYIDFSEIKKVLEFGSASAHLARYFNLKMSGLTFDCVDPGSTWQKKLQEEGIVDVYDSVFGIEKKYNLIMSSHALEHVSNTKMYFSAFSNLITPGGYLYFEIPNSEERDVIFGDTPDYHFPHTYFFTPKSFEKLASISGFEVVFTKTFSRSYSQRFNHTHTYITSSDENPKGAYLRVLLKKK